MEETASSSKTRLQSLVSELIRSVYQKYDESFLHTLTENDFASLSEEEKVQVIRETELVDSNDPELEYIKETIQSIPSQQTDKSDLTGLLRVIVKQDSVKCLKTVLQILPLYSAYTRDSKDLSMDGNNIAKVLYDNKAVWNEPYKGTSSTELDKASQIIATVSEKLDEMTHDGRSIRPQIEPVLNEIYRLQNLNTETEHDYKVDSDCIDAAFKGVQIIRMDIIAVSNKIETVKTVLATLLAIDNVTCVRTSYEQAAELGKDIAKALLCTNRLVSSILSVNYAMNKIQCACRQNHKIFWCNEQELQDNAKRASDDLDELKKTVQALGQTIQDARKKIEGASQDQKIFHRPTSEPSELKETAFTLLTAQLFVDSCAYDAKQCMKFLLEKAPKLVHVEVQGKLALGSALTSGTFRREDGEMLLLHGARVGVLDTCHELTKLYTNTCFNNAERPEDEEARSKDLSLQIKLIISGNEDQVKNYKDQDGNTLLHILTAQLPSLQTPWDPRGNWIHTRYFEGFIQCVETLLNIGIDPTHRNNAGQSVLHVVLNATAIPLGLRAFPTVFLCADLLVPFFKDTKMRDRALLENLFAAYHHDFCTDDKWIGTYQSLLDNNVLDIEFVVDSGLTPWQWLLRGATLHRSLHGCNFCEPLGEFCKQAIESGCDVNSCIATIADNQTHQKRNHCNACQYLHSGGNTHDDCCYLTLLNVLLRYGKDVRPILGLNPQNASIIKQMQEPVDLTSFHLGQRLSTPLPKMVYGPDIVKLCRGLVLYYPACSESLVISLMCSFPSSNNRSIQKLRQLLMTPRSLQFLAKRSILHSMRRWQADRLPLPNGLKKYIMTDETDEGVATELSKT